MATRKKQKAEKVLQNVASGMEPQCHVLVGTYRKSQLEKWILTKGFYNYPVHDEDAAIKAAAPFIGELWLYAGKAGKRRFSAKFEREVSAGDLAELDYPRGGDKPHSDRYLLFKVAPLAEDNVPHTTSERDAPTAHPQPRVLVRMTDFKRSAQRLADIRELAGNTKKDKLFSSLDYLPNDLLTDWVRNLFVCEDAVQYDFLSTIYPKRGLPEMPPIEYAHQSNVPCINDDLRPSPIDGASYRMGEFFCGPGGLACGALNASIENPYFKIVHAWANDYDQQTCNTYAENICPNAPESVICADVRKLQLDDPRLTPIDGFAFGFPCNDFSVVGEHKGIDGSFGPLYQYGVAVLRRFCPMWFVAENVGGLASANEGAAFRKILLSMKESGYRIYPHLYKFEEYGVPQTRHRIIIIGIRNDQPFIYYPPSPSALKPRDISSRAALEDPPIPVDAPNNSLTVQNATVVERLKYIRPGENAFTAKLPPHLQLNVKGAKISQIYKRLDPTKPAYTVTGSGGGGTHIYHYKEPRALTNRERARLQTFPDDYLFIGSKESVRKQIGMAVPPRGAQVIFEALLRTLAGIEYEHVPCNISEEGNLI